MAIFPRSEFGGVALPSVPTSIMKPPFSPWEGGLVYKLGSTCTGKFKKRWMSLSGKDRSILYWKDKPDYRSAQPFGAISVGSIMGVCVLDCRTFAIRIPGRDYILRTTSTHEKDEWLQGIFEAISVVQDVDSIDASKHQQEFSRMLLEHAPWTMKKLFRDVLSFRRNTTPLYEELTANTYSLKARDQFLEAKGIFELLKEAEESCRMPKSSSLHPSNERYEVRTHQDVYDEFRALTTRVIGFSPGHQLRSNAAQLSMALSKRSMMFQEADRYEVLSVWESFEDLCNLHETVTKTFPHVKSIIDLKACNPVTDFKHMGVPPELLGYLIDMIPREVFDQMAGIEGEQPPPMDDDQLATLQQFVNSPQMAELAKITDPAQLADMEIPQELLNALGTTFRLGGGAPDFSGLFKGFAEIFRPYLSIRGGGGPVILKNILFGRVGVITPSRRKMDCFAFLVCNRSIQGMDASLPLPMDVMFQKLPNGLVPNRLYLYDTSYDASLPLIDLPLSSIRLSKCVYDHDDGYAFELIYPPAQKGEKLKKYIFTSYLSTDAASWLSGISAASRCLKTLPTGKLRSVEDELFAFDMLEKKKHTWDADMELATCLASVVVDHIGPLKEFSADALVSAMLLATPTGPRMTHFRFSEPIQRPSDSDVWSVIDDLLPMLWRRSVPLDVVLQKITSFVSDGADLASAANQATSQLVEETMQLAVEKKRRRLQEDTSRGWPVLAANTVPTAHRRSQDVINVATEETKKPKTIEEAMEISVHPTRRASVHRTLPVGASKVEGEITYHENEVAKRDAEVELHLEDNSLYRPIMRPDALRYVLDLYGRPVFETLGVIWMCRNPSPIEDQNTLESKTMLNYMAQTLLNFRSFNMIDRGLEISVAMVFDQLVHGVADACSTTYDPECDDVVGLLDITLNNAVMRLMAGLDERLGATNSDYMRWKILGMPSVLDKVIEMLNMIFGSFMRPVVVQLCEDLKARRNNRTGSLSVDQLTKLLNILPQFVEIFKMWDTRLQRSTEQYLTTNTAEEIEAYYIACEVCSFDIFSPVWGESVELGLIDWDLRVPKNMRLSGRRCQFIGSIACDILCDIAIMDLITDIQQVWKVGDMVDLPSVIRKSLGTDLEGILAKVRGTPAEPAMALSAARRLGSASLFWAARSGSECPVSLAALYEMCGARVDPETLPSGMARRDLRTDLILQVYDSGLKPISGTDFDYVPANSEVTFVFSVTRIGNMPMGIVGINDRVWHKLESAGVHMGVDIRTDLLMQIQGTTMYLQEHNQSIFRDTIDLSAKADVFLANIIEVEVQPGHEFPLTLIFQLNAVVEHADQILGVHSDVPEVEITFLFSDKTEREKCASTIRKAQTIGASRPDHRSAVIAGNITGVLSAMTVRQEQ